MLPAYAIPIFHSVAVLLDSVPLLLLAHSINPCLQIPSITSVSRRAASNQHCCMRQPPWLRSGKCWREWAEVGGAGEWCVLVPGLLYGATAWVCWDLWKSWPANNTSFTRRQRSLETVFTCVTSVLTHNDIIPTGCVPQWKRRVGSSTAQIPEPCS